EIERSWAAGRAGRPVAAERALDPHQGVEERARCQARLELDDAVQEPWLVDDLPDRRRVPEGRDRAYGRSRQGPECFDGAVQCDFAVADVRAETDESPRHNLNPKRPGSTVPCPAPTSPPSA